MIMEKTNKDTLVNSVMKIDNLLGILKESHEKIEVV